MLKSYRLRAFTLMECLIALFVLTGSVQVYQAMTKVISQQVHHLQKDRESDWLLFCQQLRYELSESRLSKVTKDKLYVVKDTKPLAFGKSKADDFRKTSAGGRGYQPMLYDLASVTFTQFDHIVSARFEFKDGKVREFLYVFEKDR